MTPLLSMIALFVSVGIGVASDVAASPTAKLAPAAEKLDAIRRSLASFALTLARAGSGR